jgi:hypothetical protein
MKGTTMKSDCIARLMEAGISYDDATALRRISMTLHRWHELECGDGNNYGSWCITRGRKVRVTKPAASSPCTAFEHDDDGKPFLEHHHYTHGQGRDTVTYSAIPDRERGALKRLAAIMARYPGFQSYVQGDPRGASLYILRPADIKAGEDVDYTRGIAVYK